MPYATRADIEAQFGTGNVVKWADLDNDEVVVDIAARIAASLMYADAFIDDNLRGGPYNIPLATPCPTLIVDAAAKLAGVWLYESRGVADFDVKNGQPQHQLQYQKESAESLLRKLRSNEIRLDVTSASTVPEVVLDEG